MKRATLLITAVAASALALAGCAGPGGAGPSASDGKIDVVASTNVYGQIAEAIGGDAVVVTSLIAKASQDPHEFEPSASDQLTVSRAGLILENGGGYDPFMEQLIKSSGTKAPVITGVTFSSAWPAGADSSSPPEGFNEHVWYDTATAAKVADAIAKELGTLDPTHAADFTANAAEFQKGIDGLDASLATIKQAHAGEKVFVTEPVPLYLTAAAGLENVTPPAFSEAVEEGQDVPPATMLDALKLVSGGTVDVVIVNAQTGGPETDRIVSEAKGATVPVLAFTETMPADSTYLKWMASNIAELSSALS